jgi:FkbH-like protein
MTEFLNRSFRGASGCGDVMRRERPRLIEALTSERPGARVNRFEEPREVFEQRVGETLDLLAGHLEGRRHHDALYAGMRLYELHRPEVDRATNLQASRLSVDHDRQVLRECLSPHLGSGEMQRLESAYDQATAVLLADAPRHVKTLFMGDCLMAEIMAFLVPALLKEGVSIDAFPINSRDVGRLRKTLDALKLQSYDVVFFSPFSHARLPELDALLDPRQALSNRRQIDSLVQSVIEQTRVLLDVLAERFECPIYVHNASLTLRTTSTVKAAVSAAALTGSRMRARDAINRWLEGYVEAKNASTFRHLHVLDETAIVRDLGPLRAGRLLYESPFQHATALSQALADEYRIRIGALASLLGKKLVVCDLDNTLWDGVIGEGAVQHHVERQQTLRRLKDDGGIVLSIASKNDPANVRFDGGVLVADDFVAPQISWGPKTQAIDTIRKKLNLQTRHMVFLDDRPDERALAQEAHPDLLVLDPCEAEVWTRLGHWADLVHGSSDLDRTRLYQQQLERDSVAEKDGAADAAPDHAALERLGLVFTIREAAKGDLKRVAELINRTNQWNMCGSRTTFEQVRAWHESNAAHVLLGQASDRFGDMGTVCVAVLTVDGGRAEIPVFVLSCRVFGYGVETAVLAEMTRRGAALGATTLVGRYKATGQNQPGRDMYADHGFRASGDEFVRECVPPIADVTWARVEVLQDRK